MARRPAKIEVILSQGSKWFYHERYSGDVKNVSQQYTRKASAINAACREAAEQGSSVDIFNRNGTVTKLTVEQAKERAAK